jgi:hypothetical protein
LGRVTLRQLDRRHSIETVLVMYGVFPTHFAMDPLVIKAVVAAINIAHLVAVEVAQNPVKRSRKRRKSSKRGKRRFCPFYASLFAGF